MPAAYRLSVLGASSSLCPEADSTACLHLDTPSRSVLVDAGGNIPRLLKEHNRDFRTITDVIITHSHPDHTYGFPFLSHCFYSGQRPVRCWAPPEAIPVLEKLLEAYNLRDPDRYLDVEFCELQPDGITREDIVPDLETWIHPSDHHPQCIGVTFQSENQVISYSGDTSRTDTLKQLPCSPDVLLHDCQATDTYRRYFESHHTSARELGELGAELGVQTLVPFHYNFQELPVGWDDLAHEIREQFNGSVLAPRKGMAFYL